MNVHPQQRWDTPRSSSHAANADPISCPCVPGESQHCPAAHCPH